MPCCPNLIGLRLQKQTPNKIKQTPWKSLITIKGFVDHTVPYHALSLTAQQPLKLWGKNLTRVLCEVTRVTQPSDGQSEATTTRFAIARYV